MRKPVVVLVAVLVLAAAGAVARQARPATAASQTVTISAAGYKPTAVSIAVGDSVVFANKDTVAHTVQSTTRQGPVPSGRWRTSPSLGSCTRLTDR